jgi:hypothetical protein
VQKNWQWPGHAIAKGPLQSTWEQP